MDPADRKMNIQGISAFEAAEDKAHTSVIPGMDRDQNLLKENFHRTSIGNSINFAKKAKDRYDASPSPTKLKHINLGKNAIEQASFL